MESLYKIKSNYNSIDKLYEQLKSDTRYTCTKMYDTWDVRTNSNGEMMQCLVMKKNNMNGIKISFINENTVKVNHIIPNKVMYAYFGKSVKARKNVLEIIAGIIKQTVLSGPQKKAFEELEKEVSKVAL